MHFLESFSSLCSWFRKKHPRTLDYVPPPPLPETHDWQRRMTVLPYLEDLHRGPESEEELEEYDDQQIFDDHGGFSYPFVIW